MRTSPSAVPGLDDGIPAAHLTTLTGIPQGSQVPDGLCAAINVSTGLDPGIREGPLADEISHRVMVAAVMAALAEESQPRHADGDAAYDVARLFRPRTLAPPDDGQICAVLGVDIAGFARPERDDIIRRYLHEQLYKMVRMALDDSGVPWASCRHEDRGDGVFVVIPPEIPVKGLIYPFPERLCSLIRRHNHVSCPAACIQLRAALHVGPVDYDGHGFVGTDVNFMFRMLDARPLKQTLSTSGAELAVAVSDYVYRNLVCRYPSLGYPEAYRSFRFQTKETRGRAWTYLAGRATAALSRGSQRTCVV
jgi:hypothetical protein